VCAKAPNAQANTTHRQSEIFVRAAQQQSQMQTQMHACTSMHADSNKTGRNAEAPNRKAKQTKKEPRTVLQQTDANANANKHKTHAKAPNAQPMQTKNGSKKANTGRADQNANMHEQTARSREAWVRKTNTRGARYKHRNVETKPHLPERS